jgi:hypothetical protein
MKKFIILLAALVLIACSRETTEKELEIQGIHLISRKPPFTLSLPSEFELVDFSSLDYPGENSRTRTYVCVKKNKIQAEEILIVQVADKTNPQAEPMSAPPLRPYNEKRMYLKDKKKRGEFQLDYLIQVIAWNPDAPSLQPIIKKGIIIPPHWALQGQFLFLYQGDHAVFFRHSKDINSFGIKVSERGDDWGKGVISGNEKKAYEAFRNHFVQVMDSIQIKIQ